MPPGEPAIDPVQGGGHQGQGEGGPGQARALPPARPFPGQGDQQGGQDPAQERHLIGRPQPGPRLMQRQKALKYQ